MAITSLDFTYLSEAERTASLYSQVPISFFVTVLQQMARADPITNLLSPVMQSPNLPV